ncbi:MAG: preprotein translocase subunit SecE [Minisyncoccia bacterium]
MIEKIINYVKESINELKKVSWLTPSETKKITIEVILFSFLLAVIYGITDTILSRLILFLK